MQNNNYRVKGAFFENNKQTGPAFTGFIEIDGVRTEIALWPKTSAKGTNYFQVSEDKRSAAKQALKPMRAASPFRPKAQPQPTQNDMDDDIPF